MKNLFFILSSLCFIAAGTMYYIGNDSSHLSELKDFFWVPIPLGIVSLLIALKKKD